MGVVNSKVYLTEHELQYKSICQNTYVGDLPVGCWAVKDISMLGKLHDQNYDFNVSDDYGKTPLHYAIDYPESFSFLLNTSISLYSVDLEGNTPLHYAVLCNNVLAIKSLLRSISTKNNAGYSPFHLAVRNSKYESVSYILNHLYDSLFLKKSYLINDLLDSNGLSVVDNAIKNKDIKMIRILKDFINVEKAKEYLTKHGRTHYNSALEIMAVLN